MDFANVVITLLLIMDPIGNVAFFSLLIAKIPPQRRVAVLLRELGISLMLILFFFFLGKNVLTLLNLQQTSLKIAGGIILFVISLEMVFRRSQEIELPSTDEEPFIVPMAIPMIAGPGLFAAIVLFTTTYREFYWELFGAIVLAWIINATVLLISPFAEKILSRKILGAMEKLMGMILIAFAVQMLLSGVKEFFGTHLSGAAG